MGRPRRCRKIGVIPEYRCFAPEDVRSEETIDVTLDEYEALRLIDSCGYSQEEAAKQMDVSRTTVTAIYDSVRKKIAECLVYGKTLYIVSDSSCCSKDACFINEDIGKGMELSHEYFNEKGENTMRIAVTFEDGKVYGHFGHTKFFKVYDTNDGKILESKIVDTSGSGHGAIAGLLKELDVDSVICGGIGGGAQIALADAGIKLYSGVSGDCDEAVNKFIAGTLEYGTSANCNHHGEEGGHKCGDHSGEHKCGHHGDGHKCGHHK